MKFLWIWC